MELHPLNGFVHTPLTFLLNNKEENKMSVVLGTNCTVAINTISAPYTLTINNSYDTCSIFLQNTQTEPPVLFTGGGTFYTSGDEFFYKSVSSTLNISQATNSVTTLLDIPFITKTASSLLTQEQSLGSLTTGILKNTVVSSTGTLSAAIAGTDFYAPGTPHTLTINNLGSNCDIYLQNTTIVPSIPATGGGIVYTSGDDLFYSGKARTVNLSATADAITATYITQTPNSFLANEQALSALSTGILKNTTTTGVLSTAVGGTDYYAPGTPHTLTINNLSNNSDIYLQNTVNIPSIPSTGGGILYTSADDLFYSGKTRTVNLSAIADANVATYITQTPSSFLPNEQPLSALATGILKSTTATGVLSRAVPVPPGSSTGDYYGPGFPTTIFDNGLSSPYNLFIGVVNVGNRNSATGVENLGIAINALRSLTTGSFNIALGSNSLLDLTGGDYNIAIGQHALFALATTSSNNIGIGANTGGSLTSCTNCTFLGMNATSTLNGTSNATAIGANATVATSNSLVLGNGANVGIGTSSPANKLHIVGTMQQKGIVTNYTGTDIVTGQVGIQTTNGTATTILSIPVPTSPAGCLKVRIGIAVQQSTNANAAAGYGEGGAYYNGTTSTILTNTITLNTTLLWLIAAAFAISGNNLNLNVTGIGGQTINWVVSYEYFTVRNVIT